MAPVLTCGQPLPLSPLLTPLTLWSFPLLSCLLSLHNVSLHSSLPASLLPFSLPLTLPALRLLCLKLGISVKEEAGKRKYKGAYLSRARKYLEAVPPQGRQAFGDALLDTVQAVRIKVHPPQGRMGRRGGDRMSYERTQGGLVHSTGFSVSSALSPCLLLPLSLPRPFPFPTLCLLLSRSLSACCPHLSLEPEAPPSATSWISTRPRCAPSPRHSWGPSTGSSRGEKAVKAVEEQGRCRGLAGETCWRIWTRRLLPILTSLCPQSTEACKGRESRGERGGGWSVCVLCVYLFVVVFVGGRGDKCSCALCVCVCVCVCVPVDVGVCGAILSPL